MITLLLRLLVREVVLVPLALEALNQLLRRRKSDILLALVFGPLLGLRAAHARADAAHLVVDVVEHLDQVVKRLYRK